MSHNVRVVDRASGETIHPETSANIVDYNGAPLSQVVNVIKGSIEGLAGDLAKLPRDIATERDLKDMSARISKEISDSAIEQRVFIDNDKTESSSAGSYRNGITVSSVGRKSMPTLDVEGILVTFKTGLSSNTGQVFVDYHGNIHGRKTNFIASWTEWGGGGGPQVDLSDYVTSNQLTNYAKKAELPEFKVVSKGASASPRREGSLYFVSD